jgi:hypothetical protein
VLWAGDMNFRIDMPHQEVLNCCKESKYNEILAKDEFRILQTKTGKEKPMIQKGLWRDNFDLTDRSQ